MLGVFALCDLVATQMRATEAAYQRSNLLGRILMADTSRLQEHGDVLVIPIKEVPCAEISLTAESSVKAGKLQWIVDLAGVDYLSSMEIAAIIGFHNLVTQGGGKMALANLGPSLQTIFRVLKLERLFPLEYDFDEAMAAATS